MRQPLDKAALQKALDGLPDALRKQAWPHLLVLAAMRAVSKIELDPSLEALVYEHIQRASEDVAAGREPKPFQFPAETKAEPDPFESLAVEKEVS